MASKDDKFWVEDPCILFTDMAVFPVKNMTKSEKLNALTRLAIIIAIIMYFMKYDNWFVFLALSILIIIIINYYGNPENFKKQRIGTMEADEDSSNDTTASDDDEENVIENFSIVPTYAGTDFQQTVISPLFSEEWQNPPPAYDLYTNVPYPANSGSKDTFEMPLKPQSYPYGQYLTRTNLLPSDEYYSHLGCGGARSAREYQNSNFLRHDLARRENMSRIYKKSLDRRFRHSCNDTFSPFTSY